MKIRNAKKEDLNEIVSIFITESKKRPYLQKWTKKSATNDLKPFLKKKELWVAVLDEKIVGFILVGVTSSNKRIAYISEIWVIENYQRRILLLVCLAIGDSEDTLHDLCGSFAVFGNFFERFLSQSVIIGILQG